jgi:hypothetical protein
VALASEIVERRAVLTSKRAKIFFTHDRGFQIAQRFLIRQLRIKHDHELCPARETVDTMIALMFIHNSIKMIT